MKKRTHGLNAVRKQCADGSIKYLYYHRYTKARIHGDPSSPEFAAYAERLERESREQREPLVEKPRDLSWLIRAYQAAPDWKDLADSTRTIGQYDINAVEREFGEMTLKAIGERGARSVFLEWHDELAEEQPRGADAKMARLARILSFGVDREHIAVNPLASFKRAYKGDRSEIVWLPEHVAAFNTTARESLQAALALAYHTGQRRGDLLALRWSDFDGEAISLVQSKTGARVYIPCTKALLAVLIELKAAAGTSERILMNGGAPWTVEAFKQAWRYAFLTAFKEWPSKDSPKVPDLHFHDLRGTAVTMLAEAGCTVPEIAAITGHSLASATRILERYLGPTKAMAWNAIGKLNRKAGEGH